MCVILKLLFRMKRVHIGKVETNNDYREIYRKNNKSKYKMEPYL